MTTPAPSWEVFDRCPRCNADPGDPCWDIRALPHGGIRELRNPHPGRRQVGPRAGRPR